MHELSIAANIVEICEEAARKADAERVEAVHIRLGAFSGVVADSLLFGYEIVTEGTLLEGSRLEIEAVPLIIYCEPCDHLTTLATLNGLLCEHCGQPTGDIRQGKEMEIAHISITEKVTA